MCEEIVFQLSQHPGHCQSQFNYSLSQCQGVKQCFKKTKDTSTDQKIRKFGRKNQRSSVQKFRSKSRSLRKSKQITLQNEKQQKIERKIISNIDQKSSLIKKNFSNIYNIEHKKKQLSLSKKFERSRENKQNEGKKNTTLTINKNKQHNILKQPYRFIQSQELGNYNTGKLLMNQNHLLNKMLNKLI